MSCTPVVSTGRVNAIKYQFENLSSLESLSSLDISGQSRKISGKKFQFQRAATSFELLKSSERAKQVVKNWSKNDLPKQSSDTVLLRRSRNSKENNAEFRHKNDFQVNQEVKLSRHTSDPVKRSSIKRSPAFRVGDKQNKAILVKQSPIVPKEFDENKIGNLLKRCVNDMEKLHQAGLTDSLKAALRQPLPAGPPPKKPPRTFGSPVRELSPAQSSDEINKSETAKIKNKIDFLESNLILKKEINNVNTKPKPLLKSKTEFSIQGAKFLNFISCHKDTTDVLDSVNSDEHTPLLQELRKTDFLSSRFPKSENPSEHIYMEPFSHLNLRNKTNCPSIAEESKDQDVEVKLDTQKGDIRNENCVCPENHAQSDLHYLCTAIDDSIGESESSEKDGHLSLHKTYDEINILVNAAFQQKSSDSDSSSFMGNIEKESPDQKTSTSIKLCRSLTEKRKDYVRRVSQDPEKRMHSYGTVHRTFKSPIIKTFSFENDNKNDQIIESENEMITTEQEQQSGTTTTTKTTTSDRINKYNKLIEENNSNSSVKFRTKKLLLTNNNNDNTLVDSSDSINCNNKENDDNTPKLFQVCILVGYNTSSDSAYLKSKYPNDEPIPDNIEQLIFPSKSVIKTGRENQDYCLILTDDHGFKVYGYCRRVLPENSEICLPLAYCIISVTKALGFYQKLLKEIESRHGHSDSQFNNMLKTLQNSHIPNSGKYLHIKLPLSSIRPKTFFSSNHKISPKRLSLESNPKWLTESATQAAFAEHDQEMAAAAAVKSNKKSCSGLKSLVQEFEEKKQQTPPFDLGLINRSLFMRDPKFDEILIRRPNDLRLENTELSELLICLGPELLISVFSSLLLERKVILHSKNVSLLSKSVLALQSILYPFQWQYTIVTILPQSLIEICQAPFPVLAGILEIIYFEIEDGIVIDLDRKEVLQSCGDEQTIIPDSLRESLQCSLEMVDLIDQGKMLSSVLISEAFLRFFVVLFGDYRKSFFIKDDFIQAHQSQKVKFFLEWFIETSMFRHFRNDRFLPDHKDTRESIASDTTFYDLFDARMMEKGEGKTKTTQNIETIVKNSKIINKKGKTFKERFKELLK